LGERLAFWLKIGSTPKQAKSFKFFAKFTHLDSWVVTTVVVEDTSDEEDEETLQERF
jgi:hypothetical protein